MFKIIQKTIHTGIVTKAYPAELANISEHFRGRPHFDFEKWTDARPAAEVCPTGAISLRDSNDSREVTVDYGLCVFCGLCAEASSDKAVRMTQEFELATKEPPQPRPHSRIHVECRPHASATGHRASRFRERRNGCQDCWAESARNDPQSPRAFSRHPRGGCWVMQWMRSGDCGAQQSDP